MKKTYLTPSMVMVRLQHQSFICQSIMTSMSQGETHYGGGSSNNTSNNTNYDTGEARTRQFSGVWDEEW